MNYFSREKQLFFVYFAMFVQRHSPILEGKRTTSTKVAGLHYSNDGCNVGQFEKTRLGRDLSGENQCGHQESTLI